MSSEVLFESGVQQFDLKRSPIRKPVAEKQFTAVHPVLVAVLKIEDAHSWIFVRECLDEVGPIFFSLTCLIEDLGKAKVTTFSLSTL